MSLISERRSGEAAGWKGVRVNALGVVVSPREDLSRAWWRILGRLAPCCSPWRCRQPPWALSSPQVAAGRSSSIGRSRRPRRSGTPSRTPRSQWMETPAARHPLYRRRPDRLLIPLTTVAVAALGLAIFNAPGAAVTFKQAFAVVAHSQIIAALATVVSMPLNYARETMSNPANLSALAPMSRRHEFRVAAAWLDRSLSSLVDHQPLDRLLGVVQAGTSRFAWVMLGVYAALALVVAAVMAVFSGA